LPDRIGICTPQGSDMDGHIAAAPLDGLGDRGVEFGLRPTALGAKHENVHRGF